MRIGRVIGTVTLNRRSPRFAAGCLLVVDALDQAAIEKLPARVQRHTPMPESLVVYDELGAGQGQLIGISEGREASMPFRPNRVPCDAYCAAILDDVEIQKL